MATAIWETGRCLNESDPEHRKWKKLMDNCPPVDALRGSLLPRPGKKPPLYHYGFPFTRKYALDYARRHHLTIPLAVEDREKLGGRPELDFADLDDSLLAADREVRVFAAAMSCTLMVEDLSRKCDFPLHMGRPFTDAWDGIVSLWSNYDVEQRFDWCEDHEKIVKILRAAMNEADGHNSLKAQWWFDFGNEILV
ncbi:hypothetical protein LXA43DRAFT_62357 [Ganoderma leucocontextum]|nr:hypothetical protein LXA43DRAFT_62357 [Ganoderma leucocontextum]